ncbi:MAG: MerR family transcriptional regulator [Candidatus Desulfofervidus auxilii]|nr:MerR family transcriptional regulator [Candidatus Desulfofervidus auxilii]
MAEDLKNKRYFKISEVSQIVGVEPYVLRYWEKEFKEIQPYRFSSHRLYKPKDIEIVLEIKRLLYEEGFTIQGAKKQLIKRLKQQSVLREIKRELKDILTILQRKP